MMLMGTAEGMNLAVENLVPAPKIKFMEEMTPAERAQHLKEKTGVSDFPDDQDCCSFWSGQPRKHMLHKLDCPGHGKDPRTQESTRRT